MKLLSKILAASAATLMLASCNSLLDIDQHGVFNYDTFYQTDEEAEGAVVAIYTLIRNLDYTYILCKNSLSDDFWSGGGGRNDNADLERFNEFTFSEDDDYIETLFTNYYQIIYRANVVIGHVPDGSAAQKMARAEARVFRAWAYFELISLWGNPPLVDHELAPSEYSQYNGKTEELWALVESDLLTAIESGALSEKTDANTYQWRVTKQFAQAVLGKAYLWQKKYDKAAEVLDEVIESGLYTLWDGEYGYIGTHVANQCSESMFELNRIYDTANIWDNFSMIPLMIHWRIDKMNLAADTDVYTSQGWGFLCPQKGLYEDFVASEGEDGYRLNQTMKTYAQMVELGNTIKSGETMINEGYFMWKWRILADEIPSEGYGYCSLCDFRIMRYAEVLFLAAEAHLMNGNQGKCDEYVNQVRARAKASSMSGITLEQLKREKRVELCGEYLRFQDLVRWGDAYEALKDQGEKLPFLNSNGEVSYQSFNSAGNYGFKQGKHELLPYPGTEIRLNPNIQKNPGW